MGMDAGGLAQMTYHNPSSYNKQNGSSLGVPGSGFASRGKGSHIKRLSVPPPTIDESAPVSASAPRTSRSHLLAGLRTAPKQQPSTPATAPIGGQGGHSQGGGFDGGNGRYSAGLQQQQQQHSSNGYMPRHPQTATGASFPNLNQKQNNAYGAGYRHNMAQQQMYTLPEQILAPPALDFGTDEYGEPIDDQLYAELVQTNLFLAAQQQRLQQQLASVTAAAQQFQGLNLGMSMPAQQQQQQILSPSLGNGIGMGGYYGQQLQQGIQPIVQAVAGQPGLFCVYNPLTGQQNFVVDNNYQIDDMLSPTSYQDQQQQYQSPTAPVETPTFRAEVSPPPETTDSPIRKHHSPSPPRLAPTPPQDVTPLPPPSANAFRRGHKPRPSSVIRLDSDNSISSKSSAPGTGAPASAGPRSAALPPTPMTGTFGPGQGRAGEHPIRQPRGPPSLEDLIAKPTSKYEGSKNFVTRQRRRAVHNLVRKGLERRGGENHPGSCSASGGSVTPSSDAEFSFGSGSGSGSDGESGTGTGGTRSASGSGSNSTTVSTRPSISSLRAIGSERKEKKEDSSAAAARTRGSVDSMYTTGTNLSCDDVSSSPVGNGNTNGTASPTTAAIVAGRGGSGAQGQGQGSERRKMPMLVLSSAEKRKSPIL